MCSRQRVHKSISHRFDCELITNWKFRRSEDLLGRARTTKKIDPTTGPWPTAANVLIVYWRLNGTFRCAPLREKTPANGAIPTLINSDARYRWRCPRIHLQLVSSKIHVPPFRRDNWNREYLTSRYKQRLNIYRTRRFPWEIEFQNILFLFDRGRGKVLRNRRGHDESLYHFLKFAIFFFDRLRLKSSNLTAFKWECKTTGCKLTIFLFCF